MAKQPKVSVVIPTYNGVALLKKHLPFVFDAVRNGDEVVIIDDASSDESVEWCYEQFHCRTQSIKLGKRKQLIGVGKFQQGSKVVRVVVSANAVNQRFAKSCNTAVLLAKNPLIFLLNNDVRPEKEVLSVLVPYFMKDDSIFAVGCLEKNPFDTSKVSGKNVLFFARGMFIHNRASDMKTGETAWVSGGSGLFNREKWLDLGGFDIDFYPAYWEDVDLSYRARQKGWKVLFDERAVVHHHHETTNSTVFGEKKIQEMSWSSAHTFVKKHASLAQKLQHIAWMPFWIYKRFK